jgi:hypothetical protein
MNSGGIPGFHLVYFISEDTGTIFRKSTVWRWLLGMAGIVTGWLRCFLVAWQDGLRTQVFAGCDHWPRA